MFTLLKIDLLDRFVYADFFDDEYYAFVAQTENLENLLSFAISEFRSVNPSFQTIEDWTKRAEDGAYELEICPLFRGSMLLVDPGIEKALKLALKYHGGVIRKGDGLPYIIHILDISKMLYGNGRMSVDGNILMAAICHDLLEDTDCSEKEIEDTCGAEVLRIVKAVSNDPKLEDLKDWERKKEKYVASVEAGGHKAMTVCLCDKIANLNSLFAQYKKEGDTLWAKFNRGKDKKLWFEKEVLAMLKRNKLESPHMKTYEALIEDLTKLA